MPNQEQRADFMRCRTLGHQWDDIPAERKGSFGDPLWCRCLRCGTVRIDEIGSGGMLVYRHYNYPDGYQGYFKPADGPGPSRADFRNMLLMQLVRERRKARRAS